MKTTKQFAALPAASRALRLLAMIPTALTMIGCAASNTEKLSPRLAVDLPNDCERVLEEVPLPGNLDANGKRRTRRVVLRHTQAALVKANDEIDQARGCIADQREAYKGQ